MTSSLRSSLLRVRIQLMLDEPYLASAVARYPIVPVDGTICHFMATDGHFIYVNNSGCLSRTSGDLAFIFAHEVLHNVLGHIERRQDRTPELWNIAIDHATNLLLVEAGFSPPRDAILDAAFAKMSAEEIYEALLARRPVGIAAPDGASATGRAEVPSTTAASDGDLGGSAGFDLHLEIGDPRLAALDRSEEAPTPGERGRIRRDLADQVRSRLYGRAPGDPSREIEAACSDRVPWQRLLADFVSGIRTDDYRLYPPNKKHLWRGLYLPSVGAPGPQHVVVAIDTSGSMNDRDISQMLGEIASLRSSSECQMTILQCDVRITAVAVYEGWEEPEFVRSARSFRRVGYGGTNFQPVFEFVREDAEKRLADPDLLVFFTDACGVFPARAPRYPVVWLGPVIDPGGLPFGTVIPTE